MKKFALVFFTLLSFFTISHENWTPKKLSEELAHAPSVLPDRVVLTWNNDPATTQSVTWRTDTSVTVSYTHLRAHETKANLVCRLLLEKKLGVPVILSLIHI